MESRSRDASGNHQVGGQRNLPRVVGEVQRQNADAIKELQEKHGVRILRTPPDILIEFLKTWDKIAARKARRTVFKKVHDSQRAYASLVVPASASCSRRTRSWRTITGPRRSRAPPRSAPKSNPCSESGAEIRPAPVWELEMPEQSPLSSRRSG